MKKSTIWLLTIIMALTFIGLLYVQITYMNNMKRMRDDQFAEGVKRSLYAVTTRLEQDETKYYLEEDLQQMETQFYPRSNADGSMSLNYMFNTPEGINYDLTLKGNIDRKSGNQSMSDLMRGKYLYQKGLLDEVILSIINQSSNRPISERADSAEVTSYLRSELDNNGLTLPFELAVVNRVGGIVYKSAGYHPTVKDENSMFVQRLFPNDPKNKMYYLKVYFPTKSDYIFGSIRFMIPSFIFTFILLVTFICTIILAFRQKKLTEMKNDFINNMTHEFKTPISTISLAAQMLNDNAVLKSPSMLGHISTVINDETKRLRFQVEKVLQMSMFDRQKATLRLQDVDANVLIANITTTFKLKVEKYGGKIEAILGANDSTVRVDEMHFTNVIFNLLDNAVKYRREDVPLRLIVSTRDITQHGNERIEITVHDNGIGMKREDLKKIFEKFYRVSTGNRHDVKGFGLGLAYVKKMVGELGGDISVESELNTGTKFIITLPITKN
ncbi:MAG: HAMP domain-containing histidine kinase [Duncaniella sp.]|nr:HAMP domain-containing histidine kinase [Duncaniella sp.]MDE7144873.1 HAMP domain-containing histidine kinase [Duncaniella sp.]